MKNPITQAVAKLRMSLGFWALVKDPGRLEEIISLADAIEMPDVLGAMADYFARDPRGARAMEEQPRIGLVDVEALLRLPEGTFGRTFAEHVVGSGIDLKAIPELEHKDRVSYMRAHLFETHDIWHTITGFPTDLAGEFGLQAFYFAQFPAQLSAAVLAISFLNLAFFRLEEREARMDAIVRGWTMGRKAKKLFGVAWAELWETPIDEVRRSLGVVIDDPAPEKRAARAASLEVAPAAN